MRIRNVKPILPFVLAALPALAACDGAGTGPSDGTVSLSVYLTDAPGDVEEVWVEILGITLHGGQDGPLELLAAPTELIPLTDLVGVAQLLVGGVDVEDGTYTQLRMNVGDAALLSAEGIVYLKGDPALPGHLQGLPTGDLQCPSCSQSGLKVTVPNDEMEMDGEDVALVLDFDVAESFGHKAGNSGKWVMHPVIHGVLTDTPESAHAIEGTVALGGDAENPVTIPECPTGQARSITDFIPTATAVGLVDGDGNPIVRNGTVAPDGTFQVSFLPPRSYTMGYQTQMDLGDWLLVFTASVDPAQVTVGDADVTGVAYTIQSAVCQAAG